jgi:primosomal protein N'
MIAEVVFDLPRRKPFSYVIPAGMVIRPGQRVSAPLHGRSRVGVVVALRDEDAHGLKSIERPMDSVPVLSKAALELGRWAAEESLSSWGSTLMAFLPPVASRGAEVVAPPSPAHPGPASPPAELHVDSGREARLVEELRDRAGSALVIAPDREGAARWAARLDAARLDSDAPAGVRRAAWFAAARGRARISVGTRSALLTPLPPPSTLVLLDEHEAAHKPPGPPRIHSRDLLRQRAMIEGSRLLLLSATPSVESWWRAETQQAIREDPAGAGWPEMIAADTRGILRNHPLTLPLTRSLDEMTRRGRQALLIVTRRVGMLICPECGGLLRCPDCGVPLGFSRETQTLRCRLCAKSEPLPDRCVHCGGHRLVPFGWDPERVEAAVRRRFPKLTVSRADRRAQIVIGTGALLRQLSPGKLGCVGIVTLDSLLGTPDFRGGERVFQLAWAAADALAPDGRLIMQTSHPEHYAVQAVKDRDRPRFYKHELELRAELGYPPFRRICVVSVRARGEDEARARLADCGNALSGIAGLTVYPPAPMGGAQGARTGRWRFVIKGPAELPRRIGPALLPFVEQGRRGRVVVEVEMDPVS